MSAFARLCQRGFLAGLLLTVWCGCGGPRRQPHPDLPNPAYTSPDSVRVLTERIAADTANAALYYERGTVLQKLRRDSLALKDFLRAISLDSAKADYHSAAGDLLFEARDITASLPFLKKAVALNAGDPRAHLKLAKMMLFTKEYQTAFSEINTALRADVHNPEAYFLKGMVYKDLNNPSEAEASFQTTIQEDPSYSAAYFQLGQLYAARGDTLALQYWGNAARTDPSDPSALYARGKFLQDRGLYERAKEEHRAAVRLDARFAPAHYALGYIYLQQDSVEAAQPHFAEAVRHAPGSPDARYNLGLCKEILGDATGAAAEYRGALALDSAYSAAQKALVRLSEK